MKTLEQIKREIFTQEQSVSKSTLEALPYNEQEKVKRRARAKLSFLRICEKYIEKEPREEFVKKMEDDLLQRKRLIEDGFMIWAKNQPMQSDIPKLMRTYNAEMDVANVNTQLKYLKYILSNE